MHAASVGDAAIAKMLLDKRADINAKSLKGETALAIAQRLKKEDAVTLLQKAGTE
jgi:ankyrin repeat protein